MKQYRAVEGGFIHFDDNQIFLTPQVSVPVNRDVASRSRLQSLKRINKTTINDFVLENSSRGINEIHSMSKIIDSNSRRIQKNLNSRPKLLTPRIYDKPHNKSQVARF